MYYNEVNKRKVALWTRKTAPTPTPIESDVFHFVAGSGGGTVAIPCSTLDYSLDGKNFQTYTKSKVISLQENEKVFFRCQNETQTAVNAQFTLTGTLTPYGDITTLIAKNGKVTDVTVRGAFANLFANCKLENIDNLDFSSIVSIHAISAFEGIFCYANFLSLGDNFLPNLVNAVGDICLYQAFNGAEIKTVGVFLPNLVSVDGAKGLMQILSNCTNLISVKSFLPMLSSANGTNCIYLVLTFSSVKVSTTHGTTFYTPKVTATRAFWSTNGEEQGDAVAGTTYYWYE